MKILFLGDVFSLGLNAGFGRDGIFFVSYNILREFLRYPEIKVSILLDEEHQQKVKIFLHSKFPDIEFEYIYNTIG